MRSKLINTATDKHWLLASQVVWVQAGTGVIYTASGGHHGSGLPAAMILEKLAEAGEKLACVESPTIGDVWVNLRHLECVHEDSDGALLTWTMPTIYCFRTTKSSAAKLVEDWRTYVEG